jgi:RNA polymerase sigma factor (sigma-70 family)
MNQTRATSSAKRGTAVAAGDGIVAFPARGYASTGHAGAMMATSGLGAVFMANRGALLRFLRARGAGEDGEDILQELWLKVSTLSADGPIADPVAYLYRMADNLMHDRVRARMRRGRREQIWGEQSSEETDHHGAPTAERTLLARERLQRVQAALGNLSERSQAIFRRFRIDGVGQSEIARDEGISLSAVEKHLQRAYRAITAAIEEEAEAEHRWTETGKRRP